MKPEQIYQGLKELADKLGISVSEQRLSTAGFKVKSGLCKIKGQYVMILDKHLPVYKKNSILADCLREMPHEPVFVIPAVREFLTRQQKSIFKG